MALPLISPSTDVTQLIMQLNQVISQLNTAQITTVIKDTDGNRRILLGRFPDGTYGLAVSKPGEDVLGAFS